MKYKMIADFVKKIVKEENIIQKINKGNLEFNSVLVGSWVVLIFILFYIKEFTDCCLVLYM